MVRRFQLAGVLAAALAGCGAGAAGGHFTAGPCGVPLAAGQVAGQSVVCGKVKVPARHADPAGPAYRLHVVDFKAPTAQPGALPALVLLGGPGDTTAEYSAAFTPAFMDALGHEVVFFDQRGAGLSAPAPRCETPPSLLDAPADVTRALTACRDRLQGQGVDLASFDTLESADDVDLVRQALGFDRVVLVGWSYGTRLALQALRAHPAHLAGVVLDSVSVPDETPPETKPPAVDQALTALERACAADARCHAAHPNLEAKIARTTAALPVAWSAGPGGQFTQAMYGALLTQVMGRSTAPLDDVPAFVERLDGLLAGGGPLPAGSTQDLAQALGAATLPQATMYTSMTCGDDQRADPKVAAAALQGIRPALAAWYRQVDDVIFAGCGVWPYESHPASAFAPVRSDVPALLMSARFDTFTPVPWADHAAATLSHPTVVRFTDAAHIVTTTEPTGCAVQILKAFLDDPGAPPDTACAH